MESPGGASSAGPVVWLFGLSGAGKTTLANAFARHLKGQNRPVAKLDGDDLRRGLCADLGFTAEDRAENLRRAAHVARLLSDVGLTVVCSFITPLESDRTLVKSILGDRLLQAFVDTSLCECERRDPKGHYRRARRGELREFTGVSAPFERPIDPDLVLCTERDPVDRSVEVLCERMVGCVPS